MLSIIKTETLQSKGDEKSITVELRGLSTDTKPNKIGDNNIGNGSIFIEIDTGKIYFYDGENTQWLEFGGEVPTPPATPHNVFIGRYQVTNFDTGQYEEGNLYRITGSIKDANTGNTVISFNYEEPPYQLELPDGTYQFELESLEMSTGRTGTYIFSVSIDNTDRFTVQGGDYNINEISIQASMS